MFELNFSELFDVAKENNTIVILKHSERFRLIEELIDITYDKIALLNEKRKKLKNMDNQLSEILLNSILIGYFLSGNEMRTKITDYLYTTSIKKQFKYTLKTLHEFSEWKSNVNYVTFIEILFGLCYLLDFDFILFQKKLLNGKVKNK